MNRKHPKVKKLIWNKINEAICYEAHHVLSDFILSPMADKWLLEREENFRVADKQTFDRKTVAKKAAQDWIDTEVLKLLELP